MSHSHSNSDKGISRSRYDPRISPSSQNELGQRERDGDHHRGEDLVLKKYYLRHAKESRAFPGRDQDTPLLCDH